MSEDWQIVPCTDAPDAHLAGVVPVLFTAAGAVVAPWPDRLLARVPVPAGEPWALPLQRALGERDLVLRTVHPVARLHRITTAAAPPPWLGAWAEVRHHRYRPLSPALLANRAGTAIEQRLVELAKADRAAGVPAARWYRDLATYLSASYLAASYLGEGNAFRQSGKGGDAADWELSRRVIVQAINRSGSFMDIGCANGLLLQSLQGWAASNGHRIVPFGLDFIPELVELARQRLPAWQHNLWCGNAATWVPPRRFDFVHTLLGYVPPLDRAGYVERLLRAFVTTGGRLIVSDYGHGAEEPSASAMLRAWGFPVSGEAVQDRGPDRPPIEVCWVDHDGEE